MQKIFKYLLSTINIISRKKVCLSRYLPFLLLFLHFWYSSCLPISFPYIWNIYLLIPCHGSASLDGVGDIYWSRRTSLIPRVLQFCTPGPPASPSFYMLLFASKPSCWTFAPWYSETVLTLCRFICILSPIFNCDIKAGFPLKNFKF